jgi:hypothetical protein
MALHGGSFVVRQYAKEMLKVALYLRILAAHACTV